MRLTLDMLGVPYKYVTGYRSSNAARLAVQRGEIHMHSESTPGYLGVVEPSLVKTGEVIPTWYDPSFDGERFSVPKSMAGQGVPPFQEFYRDVKGGVPSGILWDVYRANLAIDQAMLRAVVDAARRRRRPPSMRCVRRSRALNNDKDYAEEAMKVMQFVPQYATGADLNARVRKTLVVKPEIKTFVADYLKSRRQVSARSTRSQCIDAHSRRRRLASCLRRCRRACIARRRRAGTVLQGQAAHRC